LADEIGELRSSVTAWELGRYKPAAAAMERLANLSGINYAWLESGNKDYLPAFTNALMVFDLPARFDRPRRLYTEVEKTVKSFLPEFLKVTRVDLCKILSVELVPVETQQLTEFIYGSKNVHITVDNIKTPYFAIFACYSSVTRQMAFFRTYDARFFLSMVNIIKRFIGAPLSELLRQSKIHAPRLSVPCIFINDADDVATKIGLPADERKRFATLIKEFAEKEEAILDAAPEGAYTLDEVKLIKLLRARQIDLKALYGFLLKITQ